MEYSHGEFALIFKALSDETRLKIISRLRGGEELCACNLLEHFSITQPTLSYHMRLLTESGLVSARKDANWMRYTINIARLCEIQAFLEGLKTLPDDVSNRKC